MQRGRVGGTVIDQRAETPARGTLSPEQASHDARQDERLRNLYKLLLLTIVAVAVVAALTFALWYRSASVAASPGHHERSVVTCPACPSLPVIPACPPCPTCPSSPACPGRTRR